MTASSMSLAGLTRPQAADRERSVRSVADMPPCGCGRPVARGPSDVASRKAAMLRGGDIREIVITNMGQARAVSAGADRTHIADAEPIHLGKDGGKEAADAAPAQRASDPGRPCRADQEPPTMHR